MKIKKKNLRKTKNKFSYKIKISDLVLLRSGSVLIQLQLI